MDEAQTVNKIEANLTQEKTVYQWRPHEGSIILQKDHVR